MFLQYTSTDESEEDEMSSEEEYVPCSESESDDPVSSPLDALITCEKLVETTPDDTIHESMDYTEVQDTTQKKYFPDSHSEAQTSPTLVKSGQNFCFVCEEPQSKISRHFKVHSKDNMEIAEALSLPAKSKKRKQLLEKLRNRGNFNHNNKVLKKGEGALKVKRRAFKNTGSTRKKYEYCIYCKGMFLRNELWRHMRGCKSKPAKTDKATEGRQRVLTIAAVAKQMKD